jgi:competence protein ComFB
MADETLAENVQFELILENTVEKLVIQKVDDMIKDIDMCRCEKCRLNACAIALNALPPHYVTTTKGALLIGIQASDYGYQANVTVEVMKALMVVKDRPHH